MINLQFTKRSYLTQTMNCLENNRAEERIIEEHIICQERQTEKMEQKKRKPLLYVSGDVPDM